MSLRTAHATGSTARRPRRPDQSVRPSIKIAAAPVRRAPRAPFVGLVLVLLIGGLGTLLLLNTLLAQGSFAVRDLNLQVARLADRQQALQQTVASLAAPQRLARRASEIGMVPTVNPAFVRMKDGRVLGKPQPAPSAPVPAPESPLVVDEESRTPVGPASAAPTDTQTNTEKPVGGESGSQDGASTTGGEQDGSGQQGQGSAGSGETTD